MGKKASTARAQPKRYLLTRREAADSMGMSLSGFQRHVQPHIDVVLVGQLVLIPPPEIETWIAKRRIGPLATNREVA